MNDIEISSEIKMLIEENAMGLATVNEDETPHCIAVGYVKVVSKNQLLITDNYILKTRQNIQRNPSVSLAVWNKEWKENCVGYELIGKAEYFKDGKWHEEIKKIQENKGEPCKGAILITIERIKKLA